MYTTIDTPRPLIDDIQVSGSRCFEAKQWREAILYYLFGVWSDDKSVTYRPKISLGEATLRLVGDEYVVYGISTPDSEFAPNVTKSLVVTSGKQNDVEVALIRFVKDNQIRQLGLSLGDHGSIILSKTPVRGELLVWANCRRNTQEMGEYLLSPR